MMLEGRAEAPIPMSYIVILMFPSRLQVTSSLLLQQSILPQKNDTTGKGR